MRAAILFALWLGLALAQQPTISAFWQGDILIVAASPGSLYLVGAGLPDTYVGQEHVELPAAGGDAAYSPVGRAWIVLRDGNGVDVVKVAIPPLRGVRVWLPGIVTEPQTRWVVILPIVARG